MLYWTRQSQRYTKSQIKGREDRHITAQWKACQGHTARRAGGMDEIIAVIFQIPSLSQCSYYGVATVYFWGVELRIRFESFYL